MSDAEPVADTPERAKLGGFFKEAWSIALLKMGAAEEEASRLLQKAGELAGWGPEEIRRLVGEVSERLAAQRRELERTLEDGVSRAVSRIKGPRREAIDALRQRVDRIEERLKQVRAERGA